MGLLKIALFSTLFVLPLGVLIRIPIYQNAFLYPIDISVAAVALLVVFKARSNWRSHLSFRFIKPLGLFLLLAVLSLVINAHRYTTEEFIVSALYLVRFIAYSSLLISLIGYTFTFLTSYRKFLALSGFVVVIGGFLQYLLYPNLRNLYYLGWDEHLYRLFATFLDPNFLGAFLVIVLLLHMYLCITSSNKRYVWAAAGFLTFIAILLTYSRSAYVMLVVSLLVFLFFLGLKRIAAIALILVCVGVFVLPKNVGGEGVNLLRTQSIVARYQTYEVAIKTIRSNPFFGVGFNAYRYVQDRSSDEGIDHAGAGVANSYLFVTATTGLIGLMAYLYFLYSLLRFGLAQKKQEKALIVGILGGIFVHALFENSLFYILIAAYMFLVIGSFLVKNSKVRT